MDKKAAVQEVQVKPLNPDFHASKLSDKLVTLGKLIMTVKANGRKKSSSLLSTNLQRFRKTAIYKNMIQDFSKSSLSQLRVSFFSGHFLKDIT